MRDRALVRLAGTAALAGGCLRIVDAFLPSSLGTQTIEDFYFFTDVFLLAGLAGIYLPQRLSLGWSGFAAFFTAVFGLLIVRSANVRFFGVGGYAVGAAITLIGTTILGALLALKAEQRPAAALWLAALAVGIAGSFVGETNMPQAAAGVLFGAGFAAAGLALLRENSEAASFADVSP